MDYIHDNDIGENMDADSDDDRFEFNDARVEEAEDRLIKKM